MIRATRCRGRGEEGSVLVEFVGLAVLLMVPLVYLLITLASLQSASLASVTLSEDVARIHASAPDRATGERRAQRAVQETAEGYALPTDSIRVDLGCSPGCSEPGARVTATVHVSVGLPLMPAGSTTVAQVRSSSTSLTPRYG
ncbi:hypothetical protein [Galactobacter caseinivorans]|uniref:Pilus assembly protein n=1 Tax=Galactobacter caseinivorans TaxID=2676123 RepID=A0A496PKF2_9MICC|nr:hypothetical protein [Galactobacter caseinivorans]RKW70999.1 hypothetical protein DWQ67_04120 [Galactobacter caseinivorans]